MNKYIIVSYQFLKKLLFDTFKTALNLFKIMIPVSLMVKVFEYFDVIPLIGKVLSPLMQIIGLPGELGIVWATTMITNIYGGMLAFYSISQNMHFTTAQVTIMCSLMLVAHTLPVELRVANKAGTKLFTMFLIRFGFALLSGFCLHIIYQTFGVLQEVSTIESNIIKPITDTSLLGWLKGEAERYAVITFYIFCLLLLMKILHAIGFIKLLTNVLKPILGVLGISKEVIPITVIGSTLGILYGGALIIKESEEKQLNKMDVFYAMTLMGLCHSLIEDSILMLSLGAHYTGVFIFRMLFAIIITWLIVKITHKMSPKWQQKLILTNET